MNVGSIAIPNQKGQIVIPSDIRATLGINDKTVLNLKMIGGGIFIQLMTLAPVSAVDDSAFLKFLKDHRGFMADDENFSPKVLKARKKQELARAENLKKVW